MKKPVLPRRRALILSGTALAAPMIASGIARAADTWPNKPVKYINLFPAGGPTDVLSRIVCQKLSELTGQQFIVDDRGGSGGNVGADVIAHSPPDGYTVGLMAVSSHAIATTLYANGTAKGTVSVAIPLGRMTIGVTDVSGTGYVDYMEGSMDEVMTLNTALTATQIQAIYNSGAPGLVQAPQFTGMSTDINGNFIFSLEGLTGSRAFTVYYSTNLPDWSVLTTLSAASGVNQFTVNPTNAAAFYRAIQP